MVIALFTLGPLGLVAARALGTVASRALRGQELIKASVNSVAHWLEAATVVMVFALLEPTTPLDWRSWLAAMAAVLVGYIVSTAGITAAIALYSR